MRKEYVCDTCDKPFKSAKECLEHETKHILEKLRETMPVDAIICPECKGTGDAWGTDGCDYKTCYTCKGKRFIVLKHVQMAVYKEIK